MTLRYGSLCAGYGGLDMGVMRVLPGELAWYAEFDPAPSRVMAAHHPGVPNGAGAHGDGGLDLRTVAALLPTPRATDGTKGGPNQRGSSGDLMLPSAVHLLPTPAVNDMGEGKTVEAWDEWTARMKATHGNGNGHGASLAIEAQRMLPTPRASLPDARVSQRARDLYSSGDMLGDIVAENKWAQYAAAIARHERAIGRPMPDPTEPGPKGGRRLSPRFVEALMMLPDRWVTGRGLTRTEELRVLGNGVVPPQAEAATRAWEADMRAEVAA